MEAQHTEAWEVLTTEQMTYIITKIKGYEHFICTVHNLVDGKNNNELSSHREANSKLIAAAPEMLMALKSMVDEFTLPDYEIFCDHSVGICNCNALAIIENAKIVIKKATE